MENAAVIKGLDAPVPAPVAAAGQGAVRRFVEFFTANIRNRNTRSAYARAVADFFRWCQAAGRLRAPRGHGRRLPKACRSQCQGLRGAQASAPLQRRDMANTLLRAGVSLVPGGSAINELLSLVILRFISEPEILQS